MTSLASVMDIGLSALFAAQAGLTGVSHNIANANTPGFSRQQALFAARRPLILSFGALGRGVDVTEIRRIQDDFLLANLRRQSSRRESFAMVDSALTEVEAILGSVDNDHLTSAINDFFAAWSDLANPPIDTSLKSYVLSRALSLVEDFHAVGRSLDEAALDLEQRIESGVVDLNGLLQQVANLNEQIAAAEIGGPQANDLRDRRDLLLTQISELAEVTVHEREDGSVDVILAGRTLVTRGSYQQLATTTQRSGDGYQLTVITADGQHPIELPTGRLEGLMTARDEHLSEVRGQLDEVARYLIDSVNTLHIEGRSGGMLGIPFFVGDSLATIEVAEAIQNDAGLIATSRSGAAGDTDIARAIAALADEGIGGPGDASVSDRYRTVLIDLAGQRSSFAFLTENQNNVVHSVQVKIASVSGVSLDEEGANMIRYQNTYNAAAKVIATVQEMYDSLFAVI